MAVARATILPSGALWRDREFALFDDRGAVVNGKREPRVHDLRITYDAELTSADFSSPRSGTFTFGFEEDTAPLERWLEPHFGRRIVVRRDANAGFPDDSTASGPTIVSTATLEAVAAWFPTLGGAAAARDRFRTNIEIGDVPPFWEDHLYGAATETIVFDIGAVRFDGVNPCARCVVPSRDAETGAVTPAFAKTLAERRAASLPHWADRSRFDHYYRLAVNTRIAPSQAGKTLALSDAVLVASLQTTLGGDGGKP